MIKRITVVFLALLLVLTLCSCNFIKQNGKPDAHEALIKEAGELAEAAALQYDAGLTFQSEYVYGLAQAEISSLRLCIDNVLWLKGEGKSKAEVTGDAPYNSFDGIVGAGMGSDAPFYFEGVLYKMQGEDEKAEECYKKAGYNPLHKDRDFYYLKKLSVDELYEIKKKARELEDRIHAAYTPRTALLTDTASGAEFSAAYHLAMAEENADNAELAAQCALNALLVGPSSPALYSGAALYAVKAGLTELAVEIINDGLFLAPDDASINYTAALMFSASGDNAKAKAFLDTAKVTATGDLLARVNALSEQTGG